MILLNFSHPLTEPQRAQIESLCGQAVERVVEAQAQFDHALPFAGQVRRLVDGLGLDPAQWQGASILLVPPALSSAAACLLAELHGRMGYFPPVVRLAPVPDSLPPRYEVAEIVNLQAVRDQARRRRS
jgi:hypothetical protein